MFGALGASGSGGYEFFVLGGNGYFLGCVLRLAETFVIWIFGGVGSLFLSGDGRF